MGGWCQPSQVSAPRGLPLLGLYGGMRAFWSAVTPDSGVEGGVLFVLGGGGGGRGITPQLIHQSTK